MLESAERNKGNNIQTPWSMAIKQFRRNKLAILGAVIITLLVIVCFYGPVFSDYSLLKTDIIDAKLKPNATHILGTDSSGRDILTRLMYGGKISIAVGFVVVLIEILIGTVVGGIAGYYGGKIDNILMRIVDIFLSLPFLPVVIILGAVMSDLNVSPQNRVFFVMIIIGVLYWPTMARMVRGQILSLREQEYMIAAEALGLKDRHKIIRHLIPNVIPTMIVTATLEIGNAILTESALSFLGLGVAMPYPSWGNMVQAVRDTNDFMLRSWMWVPPGLTIFVTVLAINFMGDGLRDAFDPKMKK
nr:oligopeptide ABC transporter permease [Ruminiclostridium cellobioparum]